MLTCLVDVDCDLSLWEWLGYRLSRMFQIFELIPFPDSEPLPSSQTSIFPTRNNILISDAAAIKVFF
jgi:hypothetical protein